jgi:hypothetical protein
LKKHELVFLGKWRVGLPNALGNRGKEKGKGIGQGALGSGICGAQLAGMGSAASNLIRNTLLSSKTQRDG